MFCAKCGSETRKESKFCTTCGNSMGTIPVPADKPGNSRASGKGRRLRPIVLFSILAILVASGMGGFLLLRDTAPIYQTIPPVASEHVLPAGVIRRVHNTSVFCSNVGITMVILSDGRLLARGGNLHGQLGIGTTESAQDFVEVMSDVISVHISGVAVFALQGDGSLWAWGGNGSGQLGDGTTTNRHSPVMIMEDVAFIAPGFAITTDGVLWAWGHNGSGRLGDGTTRDRRSPVKIMEDVAFVSVGAGMMAIRTDGSLWSWGQNNQRTPLHIRDDVVFVSAPSNSFIDTEGILWRMDRTGDEQPPTRLMENAVLAVGASSIFALSSYGEVYFFPGEQDDRGNFGKILDNVAHLNNGYALLFENPMVVSTDGSLWSCVWNWQESRWIQTLIIEDVLLP